MIAKIAVAATVLFFAQGAEVKLKEEKPGLLKKAKVTFEQAKASAQAKVPGARLLTAELEEEGGKLIYTLVYKFDGKKGQEEVNVDAVTGTVAPTEHEADPAPKAATDAKRAAPAKTPPKKPATP